MNLKKIFKILLLIGCILILIGAFLPFNILEIPLWEEEVIRHNNTYMDLSGSFIVLITIFVAICLICLKYEKFSGIFLGTALVSFIFNVIKSLNLIDNLPNKDLGLRMFFGIGFYVMVFGFLLSLVYFINWMIQLIKNVKLSKVGI